MENFSKPIKTQIMVDLKLPPEGLNLRSFTRAVERSLIDQALERSNWNKTKAAKLLQLTRTCLLSKMKRFGYRLNTIQLKEEDINAPAKPTYDLKRKNSTLPFFVREVTD